MVATCLLLLAAGPSRFSLLFGGDVMLNAITPSAKVFAGILAPVRAADVAFANLEIPLTNSRTATTRKTPEELRRRDQFILKADPCNGPFLSQAGFDLVSLGNNHAMDYGPAGLSEMRKVLKEAGIQGTGAGEDPEEAARVVVQTAPDGTRIGLISAMAFVSDRALWKVSAVTDTTPGVNGLALGGQIDESARERLSTWLRTAREECDILVVAVHWGTERKTLPNPYQVALGRALVDAGADIVWGHHPHVLQGAERYRGAPIFYSMGNLISPTPANSGLIKLTREGRRQSYEFLPTQIRGGRVSILIGSAATAARTRFAALCAAVTAKYPHPRSTPLFRSR